MFRVVDRLLIKRFISNNLILLMFFLTKTKFDFVNLNRAYEFTLNNEQDFN